MIFVVSIVAGLWISGSPSTERERRLDQQRVDHLLQISYAVDAYVNTHNAKLPISLEELKASNAYLPSLYDLQTKQLYEYRTITTSTYELCATFSLPTSSEDQSSFSSARMMNGQELRWEHSAGRNCFTLQANYQPSISPTPLAPKLIQ